MPSSTGKLLDELQLGGFTRDVRLWGVMMIVGSREHNVTIKHLTVREDARTSLQYHDHKDELLIILEDYGRGYVILEDGIRHDDGERFVRIRPGTRHRVVGPIVYLEVSTYDDNTDTIRIEDDYGRTS